MFNAVEVTSSLSRAATAAKVPFPVVAVETVGLEHPTAKRGHSMTLWVGWKPKKRGCLKSALSSLLCTLPF
jgi:hypothetical protein